MMKNIVIFCLLLCCAVSFAIEENLASDKVTPAALCEWLSADYTASVDKDGDVVCTHENREFYVTFCGSKIIMIHSVWEKPAGFDVPELIHWANKANMPFVTISVEEEDAKFYGVVSLRCYLTYEGGLNRKNFMETVSWFTATEKFSLKELQEFKGQSSASKPATSSASPASAGGALKDVPIRCRTNGLMGMPNYDAAGRTVYVKNLSDETLKIHVEQDGAYGAFGFSLSDATGDYTIAPGSEINFLTEVNRTLTISAPGYNPIEYVVEFQ